MKTGLAKQFKQVLDTQLKRAREDDAVPPAEVERERGGKRLPKTRRRS